MIWEYLALVAMGGLLVLAGVSLGSRIGRR